MTTIMKNERMRDYLSRNDHITWQFNLSQASWSAGQFERVVGLGKQALYKLIGGANLTWSGLEKVILDRVTNFVGGERELRESLEKWKQHQIERKQLQGGYKWGFQPPTASSNSSEVYHGNRGIFAHVANRSGTSVK